MVDTDFSLGENAQTLRKYVMYTHFCGYRGGGGDVEKNNRIQK
jgi:hypothetical protein